MTARRFIVSAVCAIVICITADRRGDAADKSGVSPQTLSLPSGPGSIEGLGESFEPQLNSGTFNYSVPLSFPKCRGDVVPAVSLDYGSGNGNGAVGMGWALNVPRLRRQTDKGLPLYADSDTVVDWNGEELVRMADGFFRAENESSFIRYRHTNDAWLATLRDGTVYSFGQTSQARLEHSPGATFSWQLESAEDLNGNRAEYHYLKDRNQIYLDEVVYCLHTSQPSDTFRVKCSYETGRPDCVLDYHGRFRSQTALRLNGITIYQGSRRLRYWRLAYAAGTRVSMLVSVTVFGDERSDTGAGAQVNRDYLPPLRLGYTSNSVSQSARLITATNVPSLSILSGEADLVDINRDGLPDILLNDQGVYFSILNQGERRPWSAVQRITNSPTASLASTNTRLADLRGDGKSKLLFRDDGAASFYYRDFITPNRLGPDIDFPIPGMFPLSDPNVQLVDINNDRAIDLMVTDGTRFDFLINRQSANATNYILANPTAPPASGILFSDGWQLADLNGDRLPDLVLLGAQDEGGTFFHLVKGWGEFDTREVMQGGPPTLGLRGRDAYHLADIDQDGLADLVMVDSGMVTIWFNTCSNRWSAPVTLTTGIPDFDAATTAIRFADMNGNGSVDIVWNRTDQGAGHILQYLELNPGAKPYQLNRIDNGIGRVVQIEYRSSVDYLTGALGTSQQWTSLIPFSVPVVSAFTSSDSLGGLYRTELTYRNGYYDGVEKEFRGFESAQRREIGSAAQGAPSEVTDFSFDTGATVEALKGKPLRVETRTEDGAVFSRKTNNWIARILPFAAATGETRHVTFPFVSRTTTHVLEKLPDAQGVLLQQDFTYDDYGNETMMADHGRVESGNLSAGNDERIIARTFTASNTDALRRWILALMVQEEVRDENGAVISRRQQFYDDETFSASNPGAVMRGNLTLIREWTDPSNAVAFIKSVRTKYDGYGNPVWLLDPLAQASSGTVDLAKGHARRIDYDSQFHTYPVQETIFIAQGAPQLTVQAHYDLGLGTVSNAFDFNGNESVYLHDTFGRLTGIIRPGDTPVYPTVEYGYALAIAVNATGLVNYVETRLLDKPPGTQADKRAHYFITRSFVDGLGRKRMTKQEAAADTAGGPPRVAVKDGVVFNARQQPMHLLNPFYAAQGSSLDELLVYENIESPGWTGLFAQDGALLSLGLSSAHKSTLSYDATLRETETRNPDSTRRQVVYEPFLTKTFDENDADPNSTFANTPLIHYSDGLGRLVRVDEIVRLGDDGTPSGSLNTWTTRYDYDLNDQLTRITDSQNNVKTFAYDGLKRKIIMNDPDRGVMRFLYDDASNLTETTDAKNQRITYTYDGANRILSEDYHDEGQPFSRNYAFNPAMPVSATNRPDVAYFYDVPVTGLDGGDNTTATANNTLGKLAYVWDLSGEEHTSYDFRERVSYVVKRVRDPLHGQLVSYRTGFIYDSSDRLTSLTYPDNDAIGYRYNDRNLLARITGGPTGSIISNLVCLPSGQQAEILYGNGIRTAYTYDPRLRLHTLVTARQSTPAAPLIAFGYDFDGVSNLKSITDNRPASVVPAGDRRRNTQLFQYDDLYRLTRAQYSFSLPGTAPANNGEINYRYDRIGDMLAQTSTLSDTDPHSGLPVANLGTMASGGGAGRFNRTGRAGGDPPGPHALTSIANPQSPVANRHYPYDANGNMTSLDGMAATWDFKDRLVALEDATMRPEYAYDFTDRRITKRVTKKTGSPGALAPRVAYPYTTIYVGKHFEVREFEAPTKYVWNGNTRVARVTGTLSPNQRVQRLRVYPGWNLVSVAVTALNGGAQLEATGQTDGIYRWNAGTRDFAILQPTDTLAAGSVLWVKATSGATLRLVGAYPGPMTNLRAPPEGTFLAGYGLESLPFTSQPALLTAWHYAPDFQNWQTKIGAQDFNFSDLSPSLSVGEAMYALVTSSTDLETPDPALSIRFYHQDHIGSSSVMTDATGLLVEETANYPFGQTRNAFRPKGLRADYQFTQKETDCESGLQCFEARFLIASVGRFTRVDPLSNSEPNERRALTQSCNGYSLALNNPLKYIDPSGKSAVESAEWVNNNLLNGELRGISSQLWELAKGDSSLEAYGYRTFAVAGYVLAIADDALTLASLGGSAALKVAAKKGVEEIVKVGAKEASREVAEVTAKTAALRSNADLVQEIATRAEAWGARRGLPASGGGSVQGTLKHDYAARLLDRYQSMYGSRGLVTEGSWIGGAPANYGTRGSVRLDVFDTTSGVVYDYKFTLNPSLSPRRVQQIVNNGPAGITGAVPIGPR